MSHRAMGREPGGLSVTDGCRGWGGDTPPLDLMSGIGQKKLAMFERRELLVVLKKGFGTRLIEKMLKKRFRWGSHNGLQAGWLDLHAQRAAENLSSPEYRDA